MKTLENLLNMDLITRFPLKDVHNQVYLERINFIKNFSGTQLGLSKKELGSHNKATLKENNSLLSSSILNTDGNFVWLKNGEIFKQKNKHSYAQRSHLNFYNSESLFSKKNIKYVSFFENRLRYVSCFYKSFQISETQKRNAFFFNKSVNLTSLILKKSFEYDLFQSFYENNIRKTQLKSGQINILTFLYIYSQIFCLTPKIVKAKKSIASFNIRKNIDTSLYLTIRRKTPNFESFYYSYIYIYYPQIVKKYFLNLNLNDSQIFKSYLEKISWKQVHLKSFEHLFILNNINDHYNPKDYKYLWQKHRFDLKFGLPHAHLIGGSLFSYKLTQIPSYLIKGSNIFSILDHTFDLYLNLYKFYQRKTQAYFNLKKRVRVLLKDPVKNQKTFEQKSFDIILKKLASRFSFESFLCQRTLLKFYPVVYAKRNSFISFEKRTNTPFAFLFNSFYKVYGFNNREYLSIYLFNNFFFEPFFFSTRSDFFF